jgi:hypothetical protein
MCQAVLRIDLGGAVAGGPAGELTLEGTQPDPTKHKAPGPLGSGASPIAGPRGFESRHVPVFTGLHGAADEAKIGSMRPSDPSDASHAPPLPSAVPSYLEACARLAPEAAGRGDLERARVLIAIAALASAMAARRSAAPEMARMLGGR